MLSCLALVGFQYLGAVATYSPTPGPIGSSDCWGIAFTLLVALFEEAHIDAICHAENDECDSTRTERKIQAAPLAAK
jgi:hypothetical protein